MPPIEITIKNAQINEMPLLMQFTSIDGRNPGLQNAGSYFQIDPEGYFIAINGREVVGSVSAVNYDNNFGFIGFHFVLPEFQNTELADKLLEVAIQKLGQRTIGLNCYENQVEYYQEKGFKISHKILTFEGTAKSFSPMSHEIVSPFKYPYDLLKNLDAKYFSYDRNRLLQIWLNQPGSLLLAKLVDNEYTGLGLYIPCERGYKISSLICDDICTADELLSAFVVNMSINSPYYIDVPETNSGAIRLAEKYNLRKVSEFIRMYSKNDINISLNNVFSFTNNELG